MRYMAPVVCRPWDPDAHWLIGQMGVGLGDAVSADGSCVGDIYWGLVDDLGDLDPGAARPLAT